MPGRTWKSCGYSGLWAAQGRHLSDLTRRRCSGDVCSGGKVSHMDGLLNPVLKVRRAWPCLMRGQTPPSPQRECGCSSMGAQRCGRLSVSGKEGTSEPREAPRMSLGQVVSHLGIAWLPGLGSSEQGPSAQPLPSSQITCWWEVLVVVLASGFQCGCKVLR